MNIHDIVIVGAGPAGLTAAIYAVRANISVLIVDKKSLVDFFILQMMKSKFIL